MAAPRFARRLGWRTLRKIVDNGRTDRPASFWRQLARDLAYPMYDYGVTKPITAAHLVAQLAEESDAFRTTEEYASGAEYEGRLDLGNVQAGDGKRYKGRSYIQVTGRANYRALPHWDGIDFEKHPERLAEPKYAARAACWWWRQHGLNQLAVHGDEDTVEAVTRRINGGLNGLITRRAYFVRAYPVRKHLTPSRRPPT